MPNLGLHIGFALQSSQRLGHPVFHEHLGSFLLGSTTPDIRLFVGWDRERTHFFNLATDPIGSSVEGLLKSQPHLWLCEGLTRQTIAFVLGYMCHLNTDENWIVQIYRRFFGPGSELGKDPMAKIMDRALQFELDRQERNDLPDLEGALERIQGAFEGVEIGFIESGLLQQWQGVVLQRAGRHLPWDRFRGVIQHVSPEADAEAVDRILSEVGSLLEEARGHVSEEEVQAFREKAIQDFLSAATRYLCEGRIQ